MIVRASYRSIDSLQNWFIQSQRPFWSVWTGFSKDNKDQAMKQSSIEDMDESWALLERVLRDKTAGGGRVTIFVTDKANSSHGYTEYLEIAESQPAISGIQNTAFIGGVDQYIADKIAMYDKDRKIEELSARLEEKETGTGINKIINRVLEEAPIAELIMALANRFLGAGKVPTPAVNGARIQDDFEEEELNPADQQRLHDAILRISAIFPDIVSAMEQLADFVEKNPEMAKSFLNKK